MPTALYKAPQLTPLLWELDLSESYLRLRKRFHWIGLWEKLRALQEQPFTDCWKLIPTSLILFYVLSIKLVCVRWNFDFQFSRQFH